MTPRRMLRAQRVQPGGVTSGALPRVPAADLIGIRGMENCMEVSMDSGMEAFQNSFKFKNLLIIFRKILELEVSNFPDPKVHVVPFVASPRCM